MGAKKIEKIFRIMPIQKIWNYIKEHRNLGEQEKNKDKNSTKTISFEERKRKILERESELNYKNESTPKRRDNITPEELYRMERARLRRSKRFQQLNKEESNIVNYSTNRSYRRENINFVNKSETKKVDNVILPSSVKNEKTLEARKIDKGSSTVNTRNRENDQSKRTSSRKPDTEKVVQYDSRKSEIANRKKTTIIDFKQRYAVGSNELYHYNVNRKDDRKDRSRQVGWEK